MSQTRLVALLLLSLAAPAANAAGATPRYTNAELVSVNPQTRLVVIRNADGRQQTLQLDDTVAGLDVLRAGDRVILTLREEPGMTRVSSIAKSLATTPAANPPATRPPVAVVAPVNPGISRFAEQVAALAQQAGQVDAVWNEFRTTCNVTLRSTYTDGRDWFSLWDDTAQIDVSGGICRDLVNQLVGQGETVKAGMAGAEEAARKADLAPGDLRETRRRYSMEWGGWGLPAPELLKP
jgi:hypothetical protein